MNDLNIFTFVSELGVLLMDGKKYGINKKGCEIVFQGRSDFAKDYVFGSMSFHEIITFLITQSQESKEK